MTIDYDASNLSGWIGMPRLFLRYRGTILAGTLTGPLFWLSNILHLALLILSGRIPLGRDLCPNGDWPNGAIGCGVNATVGSQGEKIDVVWTPYFQSIELLPVCD